MKNAREVIIGLCALTIISVTACSKSNGGEKNNVAATPVPVMIMQVERAGANQKISYSGTIEESRTLHLSFPVVGTVERVLVSEGDYVHRGQHLAYLNSENYKSTHEMSLAMKNQAEDAYRRLSAMHQNGNLPAIKMVDVETKLQQAKAAEAIAGKNYTDCTLIATENGIVGKRSIEPGITAVPNMNSITLVVIDRVVARISVSEKEISGIQRWDTARITIPALNDYTTKGQVKEIGILADLLAHSYKVKIEINNYNRKIRPGMLCEVSLSRKNEKRSLYVGSGVVIVDEADNRFVYVADMRRKVAKKKSVATGELLENGVEIVDGLSYGDYVISEGHHKLTDGAPIEILNEP